MQTERKPSEKKTEPQTQPIEPEMPKGQENDQSSRTPETEPPKEKRIDNL